MPAYVIVDIALKNPADASLFEDYKRETARLLDAIGVEFEAIEAEPRVIEGDWRPRMVVIQRYPDMASIEAHFNSAAYASLRALRQRICDTSIVAVNGL